MVGANDHLQASGAIRDLWSQLEAIYKYAVNLFHVLRVQLALGLICLLKDKCQTYYINI